MSVTRLQLLCDTASELGDLITLVASEDGTTTAFVAVEDMLWEDSGLNGREAWYVSNDAASAANDGKRRIVTGTTADTGAIALSPALPAATKAGDVVYLVNGRGTGVTIPEIHAKINQLIRRVGTQLAVTVAGTPATFSALAPVLTVPSTWVAFLGVEIEAGESGSGNWQPLPGEPYRVSVADSPPTVTIHRRLWGVCAGRRLRLLGATAAPELSSDSDTTTIPAAWLAKTAAYELLEAAYQRTGDVATAFTYGELLKAQQQELAGLLGKRFHGAGRRIALGA